MMKPLLILSATVLLFASCKNDTGNSCTTTTDSLQREISNRDQRISALEDSLKNAMSVNTSGNTASATDSTTANAGSMAATNSTTTTGKSFYKDNTHKGSAMPANLRTKYPGEFPEGSARILTEKDLKFLSPWGLKVILNEIYARHGIKFTDSDLQNHFNRQGWYHDTNDDNVDSKLSATERRNVTFIKSYKYTPQIGV